MFIELGKCALGNDIGLVQLLFRLHPAGEFLNGLLFVAKFGLEQMVSVSPGTHAQKSRKAAVKGGNGLKAHAFGDGEDGILGGAHQVTGLEDTDAVKVLKGTFGHDLQEYTPEMSGA